MTTRVRGSSSLTFNTVADLNAATDIRVGDFVTIESYTSTNNSGVMQGEIVPAATGVHDGGSYIDLSGSGLQFKQKFGNPINAKTFGIEGDGSIELTQIAALEAYVFANKRSAIFPKGVYDVGDANWPFRQSVISGLKDYEGVVISGEGKNNTVFRTTSALGADVLQLNGVKGISFRDLSVTAVLTSTAGAGSNGVSITNGGADIHIDIDAFDLPAVDKGAYLDGSKAFTIQNGLNTNDFTNISIKGQATNCGYAFEKSTPYDEFNISNSPIYSGISLDIIGRDCWRGVSMGASAATVAVADNNKDCDVKVNAVLINCAQPVDISRWVRADVTAHVVNTKPKGALYRPLAADQTVYGCAILGDYHSKISITGVMTDCDNKLIIGGTTQGGGVIGSCIGTKLNFELDAASVSGSEVVVVDSGGNTTSNVEVSLTNIKDGSGTALIKDGNSVLFGSSNKLSAASIRDFEVPRDGQVYPLFSADAVTGDLGFVLASSGALGAYAGWVSVKDNATGTFYKLPLYN